MQHIDTLKATHLTSVSLVALIALAMPQAAFAQTAWTGAIDQDWFNAGNWNTGALPDTTDDVVVSVPGNAPFVTGAGNAYAHDLTVGDAAGTAGLVILNEGWLSVSGDMVVSDPNAANHGEVQITGPDALLTVDGSLTITDVNEFVSFMEIADGALVTVHGTTTVGEDAALAFSGTDGGRFEGDGALVVEGDLFLAPDDGQMVLEKDIVGSGRIYVNAGTGAVVLQGDNGFFEGSIEMVAGELETGSDYALGGSRGQASLEMTGGTLRLNHQSSVSELSGAGGTIELNDVNLILNQNSDSAFSGDIDGSGGLRKFGSGSLTLAGTNTFSGLTVIEEGGLSVEGGSAISDGASVVVEEPGSFFVGTSETVAGLALYGGEAEVAAGETLIADLVLMYGGSVEGGSVEANDFHLHSGTVNSVLTGGGGLLKSGSGQAILTAHNTYTGGTTIDAGELTVTGTIGDLQVNGGAVSGDGTVGTTTVSSGGTLAPGVGIATLNAEGDVVFESGSTFDVDIGAGGQSDMLTITGAVTIDGGVVNVTSLSDYQVGALYTILHADGGGTGEFDGVSGDGDTLFLGADLGYGANDVYLQVDQVLAFDAVALTPNQKAAAGGADSLGAGNPVWDTIALTNDPDEARATFDALSGEIHPSVRTGLFEYGQAIVGAVQTRQHSTDFSDAGSTANQNTPANPMGMAFWAQGSGAIGDFDGDGNAADTELSYGGITLGADMPMGDDWHVGVIGRVSQSDVTVSERNSSSTIDNRTLGVYFSYDEDAFGFSGGLTQSWHDVETARSVMLSGDTQNLTGTYAARSLQAWAEVSYALEADRFSIEPFVGVRQARVSSDSFDETGGSAALSVAASNFDATFATLGVRGDTVLQLGDLPALLSGELAWVHAIGDKPEAQMQFVAGGDAFDVAGVALAQDTVSLGLALDLPLSENSALSVGYDGQFGSGRASHGAGLNVNFRF